VAPQPFPATLKSSTGDAARALPDDGGDLFTTFEMPVHLVAQWEAERNQETSERGRDGGPDVDALNYQNLSLFHSE
jgi:hypothetical protein